MNNSTKTLEIYKLVKVKVKKEKKMNIKYNNI